MDQHGQAKSKVAGVLGEFLAMGVVANCDHGAVDVMGAEKSWEAVDAAQDDDAVDCGAVEIRIVIDDADDGRDAGTFHELKQYAGLSARTVNDDGHRVTKCFRNPNQVAEAVKGKFREGFRNMHRSVSKGRCKKRHVGRG